MTDTLARRIFLAHMELTYRLGRRVPLAEFGALIAREMGREAPFTAAAVSRWESGTQVPGAYVIEAIARITGTDPGWISHGEKTAAPPPPRSGEYPKFESRSRPGAATPQPEPASEAEPKGGATPEDSGRSKRRRRRDS